MNSIAKNVTLAMIPALIRGNWIMATMAATMTNTTIIFDMRFANSEPYLSEWINCLIKKRYIKWKNS